MGFLDKMKSALGTSKPEEAHLDANFVENIINSVENVPFAASSSNVLYGATSELAGYHYFKTVIIGTLKLKTNKGANLKINGEDFKYSLNSDSIELESEASDEANLYVTKIDFEIEKSQIDNIDKSKIKSLVLSAKKEFVEFSIVHIEYDEEE